MGAQNFNFAPKFFSKMGIFSLIFRFLDENFSDSLKFRGQLLSFTRHDATGCA